MEQQLLGRACKLLLHKLCARAAAVHTSLTTLLGARTGPGQAASVFGTRRLVPVNSKRAWAGMPGTWQLQSPVGGSTQATTPNSLLAPCVTWLNLQHLRVQTPSYVKREMALPCEAAGRRNKEMNVKPPARSLAQCRQQQMLSAQGMRGCQGRCEKWNRECKAQGTIDLVIRGFPVVPLCTGCRSFIALEIAEKTHFLGRGK